MKLSLFFTLFLIFIIVGCTQETNGQTTPTITNEGIIVTNFTTNSNTLRINEETNVRTLLTNVGDFEAKNIISVLYGEGLLERLYEINYSDIILSNFEDFHTWSLKVPVKLSQTQTTTYTLNTRIYYFYEFRGFQQVGFVESTYSGGDLPVSSGTQDSPLKATIDVRNPVRTLTGGSTFSTTITITNVGSGNVDYYGCSALSITNPCNKNGYLNSLKISVPSDWEEVTDMSAWASNVSPDGGEITYEITYDQLEEDYKLPLNEEGNTPLSDLGTTCEYIYYEDCEGKSGSKFITCIGECTSCKERSNDDRCNLIAEALNQLRMIRGNEARLVLLFKKLEVAEPTIDAITVSGDFSYEVDTSDFTSPIRFLILGD